MVSTESTLFPLEEIDPRKEKSPHALRTISEASELLDVPQHVLRFWETKFPQIKPLKRNGGRRFYRPQDLDVLQQIKHLLYQQGYTIKGAKKAIDEFLHLRAEGVDTQEIIDNLPAASVNDNNYMPYDGSALAELVQSLREPEEGSVRALEEGMEEVAAPVSSLPREALMAIREQLLEARNRLQSLLPGANAPEALDFRLAVTV